MASGTTFPSSRLCVVFAGAFFRSDWTTFLLEPTAVSRDPGGACHAAHGSLNSTLATKGARCRFRALGQNPVHPGGSGMPTTLDSPSAQTMAPPIVLGGVRNRALDAYVSWMAFAVLPDTVVSWIRRREPWMR